MMQRVRGTGDRKRTRRWYSRVTVCDQWRSFENFRDWALANAWRKGLSPERSFSCRGYEPSNCEWITRSENSRRAAQDEWRRHLATPIEMFWGSF
jgi:hypothetical protein